MKAMSLRGFVSVGDWGGLMSEFPDAWKTRCREWTEVLDADGVVIAMFVTKNWQGSTWNG